MRRVISDLTQKNPALCHRKYRVLDYRKRSYGQKDTVQYVESIGQIDMPIVLLMDLSFFGTLSNLDVEMLFATTGVRSGAEISRPTLDTRL